MKIEEIKDRNPINPILLKGQEKHIKYHSFFLCPEKICFDHSSSDLKVDMAPILQINVPFSYRYSNKIYTFAQHIPNLCHLGQFRAAKIYKITLSGVCSSFEFLDPTSNGCVQKDTFVRWQVFLMIYSMMLIIHNFFSKLSKVAKPKTTVSLHSATQYISSHQ